MLLAHSLYGARHCRNPNYEAAAWCWELADCAPDRVQSGVVVLDALRDSEHANARCDVSTAATRLRQSGAPETRTGLSTSMGVRMDQNLFKTKKT